MIARMPFLLGGSLAMGLLAALMISRALPARPPIIKAQTGAPFHERWQEPVSPMVPKPIRVIPITPRVRSEPAKAVPIAAPPPTRNYRAPEPVSELPPHRHVAPDPPKKRAKKREEPTAKDICTRHGLRKVTTNSGRSWRCKR